MDKETRTKVLMTTFLAVLFLIFALPGRASSNHTPTDSLSSETGQINDLNNLNEEELLDENGEFQPSIRFPSSDEEDEESIHPFDGTSIEDDN